MQPENKPDGAQVEAAPEQLSMEPATKPTAPVAFQSVDPVEAASSQESHDSDTDSSFRISLEVPGIP